MTVPIKTAAEIAAKWARVTPQRQSDYEAGVAGAGAQWESEAIKAQTNFVSAITSGNIGKMYTGGIKNAGAAKYQRKASTLGVQRFGPGVQAAQEDFAKGFEPFATIIAGLTLPPRAPRGSESNNARGAVVSRALTLKRAQVRAAA